MHSDISVEWRGQLDDAEMVDLVTSHDGEAEVGWWDRIRGHSFGWVTARDAVGVLVGFVNVVWDGSDHAFLVDTKTRGSVQRHGIGTAVVQEAIRQARAAGCEWLHVDFAGGLSAFYYDACGFRPTAAGIVRLVD